MISLADLKTEERAAVIDHGRKVNVGDKYNGPHDLDLAKELT